MLKYVGKGDFILMVPARDLTDEEIKELEQRLGWKDFKGTLLKSGLYEEEAKVSRKKKEEVD